MNPNPPISLSGLPTDGLLNVHNRDAQPPDAAARTGLSARDPVMRSDSGTGPGVPRRGSGQAVFTHRGLVL